MKLLRLYRTFTLVYLSVFLTIVVLAYINGLGCRYSATITTDEDGIYTTCNYGIVSIFFNKIDEPRDVAFKINGILFSLFNYRVTYVTDTNYDELGESIAPKISSLFINNKFLFSSDYRFNEHYIGIHSNFPVESALIAEFNGTRNFQDRFRLFSDF